MALSPNADGSGGLTNRLWIKFSTGSPGFQLGQAPAIVPTYGTDVLELMHAYRIVYAFTAGSEAAIYVDPKPDEASATAYLKQATHNTFADGAGYKAIALVQNVSTKAPTLTVGNLVVATTFAEAVGESKPAAPAAPVPPPAHP